MLALDYGYDAFRIPWRIALDYKWNNEPRAKKYLSTLNFLEEEYYAKGKISAVYDHSGQLLEDYESIAAYGGNLGYFSIMNPAIAEKIYQEKILSKFYESSDNSSWDDPLNYYNQNWAWLGTALHTNSLPNLWETKETTK